MSSVAGPRLRGLQGTARIAALVGAVLVAVTFFWHPLENGDTGTMTGLIRQLGHAYLGAYLYWFGATVGSLGLLMLHHTVGGGWGFVIRRFLEAGSRLLWLIALLFLPIVGWMWFTTMYPWRDDHVMALPNVANKAPFLNPVSFCVISALLFASWFAYAHYLNKHGAEQDRELSDQERIDNSARLTVVGASGLVWYVLSMTFMTVLWVMSLTPTWISSIFGFLMVVSHALTTLTLMVWLFPKVMGDRPLTEAIPSKYYRDLGNLMLAFTMLWAYMSFSQYLITFSGNTAEEVAWYVPRTYGGWQGVSIFVILFHFVIPFYILVAGALGTWTLKDRAHSLARIAGYMVFMRMVDTWWWVAPTFRAPHFSVSLAEVGFPLLIGGIWVYFWAGELLKVRTLAPEHDPRLRNYLYEVAEHA